MFIRQTKATWCLLLGLVVLISTTSVWPQGTRGTLLGTITDDTGAVLPGVTVQITNQDTGLTRTAITNDLGRYNAPNLSLGLYQVSAELTGFKTTTISDIRLTVGSQITADLVLQIGEVTEQVTVIGGGELVDTTSVTMQSLVDEIKIRELPLNGRDYLQLALLNPGTVQMRGQRQVRISPQTGTGLNMSISGGRPTSNTFRIDGIMVNDAAGSSPGSVFGANLGVDAIKEFSVMSSTFSAEHGRGAGGVVSSVLRSGTNQLHGSLHYFHRNRVLDARNFFDGADTPNFRRHQFGATGGGPIIEDRIFIFAAWEGFRQFRGETRTADVPTVAAKKGQFVGPDGVLGTSDDEFIPVPSRHLPFISKIPDPNSKISGDFGVFAHAAGLDVEADFFVLRGDVQINDVSSFNASYLIEDATILNRGGLDLGSLTSTSRRQLIATTLTSVITPSLINSVRVGYSRPKGGTGAQTSDFPEFNVPSAEFSFIPLRPPGILDIGSVETWFIGFESEDTEDLLMQSTQFFEDVGYTSGNHDFKFGFSVEFDAPRIIAANRENGAFEYDSWEDFLRDEPDAFRAQFEGSDTTRYFRQNLWGAYFQDAFRIRPNLTLTLGLRYEYAEDIQEIDGQSVQSAFGNDFATGLSVDELILGEGFFADMPRYDLGNFSPRFGFAWDVFDDGKTSVRGGFGVYGEMILTPWMNLVGLRLPPFFTRGTSSDAIRPLLVGSFPTLANDIFNSEESVLTVDPIEESPSQPYRMQFNLNVQQQVARNTVATVAYVGALGRNFGHVQRDVNLAQGRELNGRLFFDSGQAKRNTDFGQMTARMFNSNNFYHSLQMGLNRRFTEGFRVQGSYTFSKAIDDGSTVFSGNQYDNSIPNPYFADNQYSRAPADFDIRQAFNLNGTIDLPGPVDGTAGMILGGWKIGGILSLITGVPVTPRQDNDRMQSLTNANKTSVGHRVDLAPGADHGAEPPDGSPRDMVFDPSAFIPSLILCSNGETTNGNCGDLGAGITQTGGFAGQVGRNTVFTDGLVTFDMSLTKSTQVSENVDIEFRAEFFNLFNNVNFDIPSKTGNIVVFRGNGGTDTASGVGFSRRTVTRSREIQLGFKLIF